MVYRAGSRIKISEGDLVEKGMKLYPHWKAVEQKCNVTCIDILRTSTGEEKLGTSTWQAEYGDTVSGAAAGCTSGAGIYYPGREFVDVLRLLCRNRTTRYIVIFKMP